MLLSCSSISVHHAVFQTSDSSLVYTIDSHGSGFRRTTISKLDVRPITTSSTEGERCATIKYHSIRKAEVDVHGRNFKPERTNRNLSTYARPIALKRMGY